MAQGEVGGRDDDAAFALSAATVAASALLSAADTVVEGRGGKANEGSWEATLSRPVKTCVKHDNIPYEFW